MDIITIEELESAYGLLKELEVLEEEKRWLYTPVSSPNGRVSEGARGNTVSNPTAAAVAKIQALDSKISAKRDEVADKIEQIEEWLDAVEDSELRSIVRWHYLLGLDWGKTTKKMYGYYNYHTCRKKVMRYFGREK